MRNLGPHRNSKMIQNLGMYDCLATCSHGAEDYQFTYQNKIKIKESFDSKPTHINKLFENEEAFLNAPII
jgi:hypothetical protein